MIYEIAKADAVERAQKTQKNVDICYYRGVSPHNYFIKDVDQPLPEDAIHVSTAHCNGIVVSEVGDGSDDEAVMEYVEEEEPKPDYYSVAIHFVDRCYGGPEEGGWWYNAGHPITEVLKGYDNMTPEDSLPKCFLTEDEAQTYCDLLNNKLAAGPNKGRRSIYSMASEGRYQAMVQAGWPHAWPNPAPHYE
jgi:hypothetical protein